MKFLTIPAKLIMMIAVTIVISTSAQADPGMRCEEAKMNLINADNALAQATALLAQLPQICGSALACIVTGQNHYNNAVAAQQEAARMKRFACNCQEAVARENAAQQAFNQAQIILLKLPQICGSALACIVTGQNHYNQAQQSLTDAQMERVRACSGGGHGHRPGPGHGGPRPGPWR